MGEIHYRPFRNSDPPALAEIWRSQPPERGLVQPLSADQFEQLVLAKPYFENTGLIVALDGSQPVGFAHAAFGPTDNEEGLSTLLGVTCLVMVRPNYQGRGIGKQLLGHSEAYLRQRGAQVLYAGGIRPLNGFYLGLYGGSELPGVLDSAPRAQRLFLSSGYREIDRVMVLHGDLTRFRAVVDRRQMQIRRRTKIESLADPPLRTWWEATTVGGFERTRFQLFAREGGPPLTTATFWDIQPLSASWGVHAAGLMDLDVSAEHRREGLATFLLCEAFRQLSSQRISLVEAQTMQHNAPALALYKKLGFEVVDQGAVYRKA